MAGIVVNPLSPATADMSPRLDLRVLLIGAAESDATTQAWESELKRQGVAYTLLRQPTADKPVTRAQLVDPADPTHGFYNGVVLATDSSAFFGGLNEVFRYEREFGVRQLAGFEYPRSQVGLSDAVSAGDVSGKTATLSTAGKAVFPYLRGSVPLDQGSFGYLATAASPNFTTYASINSGANPILGVYQHPDDAADPRAGVAEMVMTVNYNDSMLHWRLLSRGMISWVTKGVHLGLSRNFLANQVDDVFVENSLWDPVANCTPGEVPSDCTGSEGTERTTRMSASDVDAVVSWQQKYGFKLDMTFNASGASSDDSLTTALLNRKSSFRWTNHTWSHPFMGCQAFRVADDPGSGCATWMSTEEIISEIKQNKSWALRNDLPDFRKYELVTGEHSGLDNPNMPAALSYMGINVIAADASRAPAQQIGPAVTAPRYPSNVYYNVATFSDQLDEYNYIYLPPSLGGKCVNTSTTTCLSRAATKEEYLASETKIMLGHTLANDPRPGFSHQSNLRKDRIILVLLGRVLDKYRSLYADNAPIVNPNLTQSARTLTKQSAWADDVASGRVQASVQNGTVTITVTGSTSATVPITVPKGTLTTSGSNFGSSYAGSRSKWQTIAAGQSLILKLPAV